MFHFWHVLAIIIVVLLGYGFGRWTLKRWHDEEIMSIKNYYERRRREWRKEKEWNARLQ